MIQPHRSFVAILGSTGLISLSLQQEILTTTDYNILLLSTQKKRNHNHPRIVSLTVADLCHKSNRTQNYLVTSLILISWRGNPRFMPSEPFFDRLLIDYQTCVSTLKPSRVFFLSTAGCLYPHHETPANEQTTPLPANEYASQKLRFENALLTTCLLEHISFSSLRVSSVFGPLPQTSSLGLINAWAHNLFNHNPLTVYNTPSSILNLLDVGSLTQVIVKLSQLSDLPGIINISHPDHITIKDIIAIFASYHSYSPTFIHVQPLIHRVIRLDSSLLRSLLPHFQYPTLPSQIRSCIDDVRSYYS